MACPFWCGQLPRDVSPGAIWLVSQGTTQGKREQDTSFNRHWIFLPLLDEVIFCESSSCENSVTIPLTSRSQKTIRLHERDALVEGAKQTATIVSRSSAFVCPRLPDVADQLAPEGLVSSWSLPAVAVKNARLFFENDRHSDIFVYTFSIKPSLAATDVVIHIDLSFSRGRTGAFQVEQKLRCAVDIGGGTFRSSVNVQFIALWLSPDGASRLSSEQMDDIAGIISARNQDLLEPLVDQLSKTLDLLRSQSKVQADKLASLCLDMLEKYESQQQPWSAYRAEVTIIDRPGAKYVMKFPAYHLGKRYREETSMHRAIVALGSNIGDRAELIQASLRAMKRKGIHVKATSFLYETQAMYYEEQDTFLNAVCEVCFFLSHSAA